MWFLCRQCLWWQKTSYQYPFSACWKTAHVETCECVMGGVWAVDRYRAAHSDPSNGTTFSLDSWIPKPIVAGASHYLFHWVNSPPTPQACPSVSSALPLAFSTQLEIFALGFHPLFTFLSHDFLLWWSQPFVQLQLICGMNRTHVSNVKYWKYLSDDFSCASTFSLGLRCFNNYILVCIGYIF